MKEIRDNETTLREERKAEKLRAKEAARAALIAAPDAETDAMAAVMGFGGFGGAKR